MPVPPHQFPRGEGAFLQGDEDDLSIILAVSPPALALAAGSQWILSEELHNFDPDLAGPSYLSSVRVFPISPG